MATGAAVLALLRAYRPALGSPEEKAAFAVHLAALAAGLDLIASGARADAGDAAPATEGDPVTGWNGTPGVFSFLYALPGAAQGAQASASAAGKAEPSRRAVVKCLSVGDKLVVDACHVAAEGTGAEEGRGPVLHTELRLADYIADVAPGTEDYAHMYKDLNGLVGAVSEHILEPLLGKQSTPAPAQQQTQSTATRGDTAAAEESRPSRTAEGDRPGTLPGIVYPPVPVGPTPYDDLTPGGGAGIMPARDPGFPGHGMLVGPDDPRWGGMRPGLDQGGGILDDDDVGLGRMPRPGIPPGARFDPYGPPGIPGFEPGRFGEGPPRRQPRGPGGGFGDLQHFF